MKERGHKGREFLTQTSKGLCITLQQIPEPSNRLSLRHRERTYRSGQHLAGRHLPSPSFLSPPSPFLFSEPFAFSFKEDNVTGMINGEATTQKRQLAASVRRRLLNKSATMARPVALCVRCSPFLQPGTLLEEPDQVAIPRIFPFKTDNSTTMVNYTAGGCKRCQSGLYSKQACLCAAIFTACVLPSAFLIYARDLKSSVALKRGFRKGGQCNISLPRVLRLKQPTYGCHLRNQGVATTPVWECPRNRL